MMLSDRAIIERITTSRARRSSRAALESCCWRPQRTILKYLSSLLWDHCWYVSYTATIRRDSIHIQFISKGAGNCLLQRQISRYHNEVVHTYCAPRSGRSRCLVLVGPGGRHDLGHEHSAVQVHGND